jgi:hypothetical protein
MKTETGHTKGPWKIIATFSHPLNIVDTYHAAIAEVTYGAHPQECEANAELIASAPSLLASNERLAGEVKVLREALAALHSAGEAHMNCHPSEGRAKFAESNAAFYKALDQARAALASMGREGGE